MSLVAITQLIGAALGLIASLFAVPGLREALRSGTQARVGAFRTWLRSLRGQHVTGMGTATIGPTTSFGTGSGRAGVGFPAGATPDERFDILRQYAEATRDILYKSLEERDVQLKQLRTDFEQALAGHGARLAQTRRTLALQGSAATRRQLALVPVVAAGAMLAAAPELIVPDGLVGWAIRLTSVLGVTAVLSWLILASPLSEDLEPA